MMSSPPMNDLLELMDDGEPDGPDYIFGDTSPDSNDNSPVVEKRVTRSFQRVGKGQQLLQAALMHAVIRNSRKKPLAIGRPAVPIQETRSVSETFTYIPDPDELERMRGFSHVPRPNPEDEALSRIAVENLIEVDEGDVQRVRDVSSEVADELSELMLYKGASFLMGYDEASARVEAILRDGLGVDAKIDGSVSEGMSFLLKLAVFSHMAEKMPIPKEQKTRFMDRFVDLLAEDAHNAMRKIDTSERYRSMLNNLSARMTKSKTPSGGEVRSGPAGVVRTRSGRGLNVHENSRTDDHHSYNEQQNAGTRFST